MNEFLCVLFFVISIIIVRRLFRKKCENCGGVLEERSIPYHDEGATFIEHFVICTTCGKCEHCEKKRIEVDEHIHGH